MSGIDKHTERCVQEFLAYCSVAAEHNDPVELRHIAGAIRAIREGAGERVDDITAQMLAALRAVEADAVSIGCKENAISDATREKVEKAIALAGGRDEMAERARKERPIPECPYCGTTHGLRIASEGYGPVAPDYICEDCFTGTDTGPCFDDLPKVEGGK